MAWASSGANWLMDIGHILVVCVGNICRSPMAEALLRQALGNDSGITVSSAGIAALVDHPVSQHAIDLMSERGIDITSHRARQLTPELVSQADLILVMETRHKRVLDSDEPTARGKVYRLGEWQDVDIADPFQQPRETFEEALTLIDQGIEDWVKRLKA